MASELEKLIEFYYESYGYYPASHTMITQAGSPRKYFRFVKDDATILGVYSDNTVETCTFIYYSEVFTELKLNTPKVLKVSNDKKCYFIEDFGDDLLLDLLLKSKSEKKTEPKIIELYKKSLVALAKMQCKTASKIDFHKAYMFEKFDSQAILLDLNYFKYYFLNRTGIIYDEKKLQDDFEKFADSLCLNGDTLFMFRDFQARNIVIKNGEPYFIDYQGGRIGAPEYDLASILYQAKADLEEETRIQLRDYYFSELQKHISIDYDDFCFKFYQYVYLRVLQTLGAYGLRGLIENKQHFVESIPFALKNLKQLLKFHTFPKYLTEMNRVLKLLSETKMFENEIFTKFTIQVFSFSFKKGMPVDSSGNGGGFVFDCRGIHNPGRYAEYKTKTGKDKDVIDFFKAQSNIDEFFENVVSVVKPTIENYIERGFNSLMISFGCTGGQHRSVYCAEAMTRYLRETYGVDVILKHRELS